MSDSKVPFQPSILEARKIAKKGSKNIKANAAAKKAVQRYRDALGRFARKVPAGKLKKAGARPTPTGIRAPVQITKVHATQPLALGKGVKVTTPRVSLGPMKSARPGSMLPEWNGIELFPVISSNVAAYGYSEEEATLVVQFLDGSIYEYFDVDEGIWAMFQTAPSKGKFVWAYLRDKYAYERVA